MSSVNYNLGNKGVRLIPSEKIWEKGKNGNFHLSKNYKIIGKMDVSMPNMIVSVTDKKKPTYKGDVSNLNRMAKKQIIPFAVSCTFFTHSNSASYSAFIACMSSTLPPLSGWCLNASVLYCRLSSSIVSTFTKYFMSYPFPADFCRRRSASDFIYNLL